MTDDEPVEQESDLARVCRIFGYRWISGVIEVSECENCQGPDNCKCWYKSEPEGKKGL